jgi:hypothetical protein
VAGTEIASDALNEDAGVSFNENGHRSDSVGI